MLSKPAKTLVYALSVTGSLIGIGAFLLWKYQDKLLYFPGGEDRRPEDNPPGWRNPGEVRLKYEDVIINTLDNIKLHGWMVKTETPKQSPTVVIFQGNAGNIGYRIPYIQHLYKYCNSNVLIVAYRGYSNSEGIPSEKGIQKDSLAILDHVFSREDIDTNRIYILGTSIGGAVGIYSLAHKQYRSAGLILENTFTSISDMVDIVFPKLSKVKNLILANHWESLHRIKKLKVPMLFITGLRDELVPPKHMQRLYEAAVVSPYKEIVAIEDGDHNDTWYVGKDQYFNGIAKFMEKVESKNQFISPNL